MLKIIHAPHGILTREVREVKKIDKKIKYDDEYDAIAVGITCLNSQLK
jgi:Holliday junction resolvasome RuvABC endonuclease subunit